MNMLVGSRNIHTYYNVGQTIRELGTYSVTDNWEAGSASTFIMILQITGKFPTAYILNQTAAGRGNGAKKRNKMTRREIERIREIGWK